MRKKNFNYYWHSVLLRIEAFKFKQLKKNSMHQALVERKRMEYNDMLPQKWMTHIPKTDEFYTYSYFSHFPDSLGPKILFNDAYSFENHIPKSLKNTDLLNPLLPFYYGTLLWNQWKSHGLYRQEMIDIADYMLEKIEYSDIGGLLRYHEAYPTFNLEPNYISGITQGLACSYYTRMYTLTQKDKYKKAAESLFEPMTHPKDQGGLLVSTPIGMEWVEEYPSKPSSYVLNGFVFSIIGAYDLYQITKDPTHQFYYNAWLKSFTTHLIDYQFKEYILHNKYQNKLGNIEYQGLNVGQFLHLAMISQSLLFFQFFIFYYERCPWNRFYSFYGLSEIQEQQEIHKFYNDITKPNTLS